jgi:HEAT repeat protein
VSDLIRLLDDSSYHVRCVAVGALASWRHPRILLALLKTLDHMHERTPWGALPRRYRVPIGVVTDALIAQGASAVAPLLPRLQSGPRPVREAVAEVLSWSPDPHPRVRAALLGALRDADPEVRARAAKALGKVVYVGAVVPLAEALSDGTWFVRLQAARALGAIAHPRAIAPLVSALTDEYWQVRAAAADALRRLGDLAVPALTHCLFTSRDRYAKEQIVEELQRTSLIQEQIDALDEAHPGAGFAAQRLLREIVRHGATRILLEALRRHPTPAVRLRLIDILEGQGSHQVVAALHDVMNGDADAGVREAACCALTTGGQNPAGRNTAQERAA